jgi:predicted nucleic acid-binding protein
MILLDTNVISELMKPEPDPAVRDWLSHLGETPLATTVITIAEISYGLHRLADGRRRAALETRFEDYVGANSPLAVLPLEDIAAREAGRFRALRVSMGLGAQPSDMMIAGIVAAMGASLATRNVKDFDGLPIQLIDPWIATGA